MVAGLGVPEAEDTELQKKNCAGFGSWVDKQRFRRLYTPRICWVSKDWTPRLKLTAQAEWITCVRVDLSSSRFLDVRPRSERLKSLGKAMIFFLSSSEGKTLILLRDSWMRFQASSSLEALTRAQIFETSFRFRS